MARALDNLRGGEFLSLTRNGDDVLFEVSDGRRVHPGRFKGCSRLEFEENLVANWEPHWTDETVIHDSIDMISSLRPDILGCNAEDDHLSVVTEPTSLHHGTLRIWTEGIEIHEVVKLCAHSPGTEARA